MGIQIGDLKKKTRVVAVEYEGETAMVTYRPGEFTVEAEIQMNQALEENRPANGIAEQLFRIVTDWDVVDEKGAPVTVDMKEIRRFPQSFLMLVSQTIAEDMRPNGPSAGR